MTTHAWNPTDRDRMIYRWVKFDGHKQSWVANTLEIHQSTVSRIVDRYERWVAHGGPAQQGALTRDERLRAQRWLTYERNEWMLTSALRMAGEMEQMSDTSKSTTKHYRSQPSRQVEVRTEDSIRDRTGMVCRYLRLAYRINMDQLKLVQQDDLPALEPLTLDDCEYAEALADVKPKYLEVPTSESNSAFRTPPSAFDDIDRGTTDPDVGRGSPNPAPDTLTRRASEGEPLSTPTGPAPQADLATSPSPCLPVSPSPCPLNASTTHTLHNSEPSKSPLTADSTVTSIEISPHKKPTAHAYPVAANPPEPTDPLEPILDATPQEPTPPQRILPIHVLLGAP